MKKRQALHIYLFRHGQTYYNRDKIFTGWKNSKLTPLGIKQARKVAQELKNKKIDVAFQTELTRSKQTLKEVLRFHPETNEIITANHMIERSYGDLEGTSHEKFIELIGKKMINLEKQGDAIENLEPEQRKKIARFLGEQEYKIIHRGWDNPPPNGESFAMVEKRVRIFIKDLIKFMKKEKVNVAISAHGNSIRLFRKIWEKLSVKQTEEMFVPYDKVFAYRVGV